MSTAASPALAGRLPPPTVSGFSCRVTHDEGAVRVGVAGELDISNEARFAAVLERGQATSALVVVDLRGLQFLSCGGLRALLNAARRARATGGRLVVVHGPGAVSRLFEIVDVTFEIELVDRTPSRLLPPRCWRGDAATSAKADAEPQLGAMPKERVRIDKDVVMNERPVSTSRP